MPITYIKNGDIFDSKMQTLVNPVNCVGVMGKGLAKEFLRRCPNTFGDYFKACQDKTFHPGTLLIIDVTGKTGDKRKIICFPTKLHWKDSSKLIYISLGLAMLHRYREFEIESLAIPALGCGLGQLHWSEVKREIEHFLSELSIPIEVYEPKEK